MDYFNYLQAQPGMTNLQGVELPKPTPIPKATTTTTTPPPARKQQSKRMTKEDVKKAADKFLAMACQQQAVHSGQEAQKNAAAQALAAMQLQHNMTVQAMQPKKVMLESKPIMGDLKMCAAGSLSRHILVDETQDLRQVGNVFSQFGSLTLTLVYRTSGPSTLVSFNTVNEAVAAKRAVTALKLEFVVDPLKVQPLSKKARSKALSGAASGAHSPINQMKKIKAAVASASASGAHSPLSYASSYVSGASSFASSPFSFSGVQSPYSASYAASGASTPGAMPHVGPMSLMEQVRQLQALQQSAWHSAAAAAAQSPEASPAKLRATAKTFVPLSAKAPAFTPATSMVEPTEAVKAKEEEKVEVVAKVEEATVELAEVAAEEGKKKRKKNNKKNKKSKANKAKVEQLPAPSASSWRKGGVAAPSAGKRPSASGQRFAAGPSGVGFAARTLKPVEPKAQPRLPFVDLGGVDLD